MGTWESPTDMLNDIERRHLANHTKPYYDWIRHVVTIAVASLTALVALQGHYVPMHPRVPWLLGACWVALSSTVAFGLCALQTEYSLPLNRARELRAIRKQLGDASAANSIISQNGAVSPPWHHKWVVRAMLVALLIALSALCAFAVANLPS